MAIQQQWQPSSKPLVAIQQQWQPSSKPLVAIQQQWQPSSKPLVAIQQQWQPSSKPLVAIQQQWQPSSKPLVAIRNPQSSQLWHAACTCGGDTQTPCEVTGQGMWGQPQHMVAGLIMIARDGCHQQSTQWLHLCAVAKEHKTS